MSSPPREPTERMLRAGYEPAADVQVNGIGAMIAAAWRAMWDTWALDDTVRCLDAAPQTDAKDQSASTPDGGGFRPSQEGGAGSDADPIAPQTDATYLAEMDEIRKMPKSPTPSEVAIAQAVAAERERCARVCEALPEDGAIHYDDCAAAIRKGP